MHCQRQVGLRRGWRSVGGTMRVIHIPANREQPMTELRLDAKPMWKALAAGINNSTETIERVVVGDPSARRRFEDMIMVVDDWRLFVDILVAEGLANPYRHAPVTRR